MTEPIKTGKDLFKKWVNEESNISMSDMIDIELRKILKICEPIIENHGNLREFCSLETPEEDKQYFAFQDMVNQLRGSLCCPLIIRNRTSQSITVIALMFQRKWNLNLFKW